MGPFLEPTCVPRASARRGDRFLGLHKGELGFKVVVTDESQQEAKWSEWNRMLLAKNGTAGVTVRSARLHPGRRMKVAVLGGDYRQTGADGRLDLDRTVDTLRRAEAFMDAALGASE
jgi:hypothetical protein